ncbi:MAG: hypothetical protein OES57_14765, partial [Acidimicrobiia bacterium]|nr:hypothetical protein [Acidimicrobiia bacterium]
GFRAALVAGVTVYAYLTHVPAACWGRDWIGGGAAEVSFRAPVVDGDPVDCAPRVVDDRLIVDAVVDDEARATATFGQGDGGVAQPHRAGDELRPVELVLAGEWDGYGTRAGDDLPIYTSEGLVHPAVWPALANDVFHAQLVQGSWIHTRSRIRHHGTALVGARARVEATVFDRFETRTGERAVADVTISVDGRPVATLEHEAIVRLAH